MNRVGSLNKNYLMSHRKCSIIQVWTDSFYSFYMSAHKAAQKTRMMKIVWEYHKKNNKRWRRLILRSNWFLLAKRSQCFICQIKRKEREEEKKKEGKNKWLLKAPYFRDYFHTPQTNGWFKAWKQLVHVIENEIKNYQDNLNEIINDHLIMNG